jgi:hypothetical protein
LDTHGVALIRDCEFDAEFQVDNSSELEKPLNKHPELQYELRGEDLNLRYKTSAVSQTRSGQLRVLRSLRIGLENKERLITIFCKIKPHFYESDPATSVHTVFYRH